MIPCPGCGEMCPDGQSRCGECGRPLPISGVEPHPARDIPPLCTCNGAGICTACVLELLEKGQPL